MSALPFTQESAHKKVKLAQNLWNTRNPHSVAQAYTEDSVWRNRDSFLKGRGEIEAFLKGKWEKENSYKLRKELFAFSGNKIAVEFWYEHSATTSTSSQWFRTYGLEHWVFAEDGKMKSRQMSGNTIEILESERWFRDLESIDEGDVPVGHM